jgi:hypothetical protein
VLRDPTEVCPLARGVMWPPYPHDYRMAFAFSVVLYLLVRRSHFRACYPLGDANRLTTFRLCACVG